MYLVKKVKIEEAVSALAALKAAEPWHEPLGDVYILKTKDRTVGIYREEVYIKGTIGYDSKYPSCRICLKMSRIQTVLDALNKSLDKKTKDEEKQFKARTKAKTKYELERLWRIYKAGLLKENLLAQRIIRLSSLSRELRKLHPKCVACGILFGGYHMEHPNKTPIGSACFSCFHYFEKQGLEKFKGRIEMRKKREKNETD